VHCAHACKVTAPTDKNSGNEIKISTTSEISPFSAIKQFLGHPSTIFCAGSA
jgi:hypothetical protein